MSCISINLKKNEILIKIYNDSKQEDIVKELNTKLVELKKLYKEEKTPIRITGKMLEKDEIDEIRKIIKSNIDVDVKFDSLRTLGLYSITRSFKKDVGVSETKFHKGSLRSGQRIEVEGSIVIIGDVNSGAEVVAADNIIILGTLRGLAHAGAKGNKEAIIAAGGLDAVQLRISNIVKELNKEQEGTQGQVYISVEDEKINIKYLRSAY